MDTLLQGRECYIPKNATKADTPEGIEAWYFEYSGKPAAIVFVGKSQKPALRCYFMHEHSRSDRVQKMIDSYNNRKAEVKKRAEARKAPHTLKVGDILYTSWGYEQTNVDFYQVTKVVSDRTVKIREIGKTVVRSEGHSDYVVPVQNSFRGEEEIKRVQHGNYIRITSYSNASPWDGKPKYQTALGWGH